jgi:hypothetical protein
MAALFHCPAQAKRLSLLAVLSVFCLGLVLPARAISRDATGFARAFETQLKEEQPEQPASGQEACTGDFALEEEGRTGLFVGNNPVSRIDPFGLDANSVIGPNGSAVGPSSGSMFDFGGGNAPNGPFYSPSPHSSNPYDNPITGVPLMLGQAFEDLEGFIDYLANNFLSTRGGEFHVSDLLMALGPQFSGIKLGPELETTSKCVTTADKFSRTPMSLMDEMVLDSAKQGNGIKLFDNLGDADFKGMEKWSYGETSANFLRSEVHYVRDPNSG